MLKEAIAKAVAGQDLAEAEMAQVMGEIMDGQGTPAQIGALLVSLRMKGETVEEIAGAARAMRARCLAVPSQAQARGEVILDTCGTGGDHAGTFNVSTLTALVAAGAGARVAKHGNRCVSSSCGSADLMEALGVNLSLSPEEIGRCLDEVGLGFLFAPGLHLAMRHAVGPRRELGLRTIFNLLGPLTNPAGAGAQLLGVYDGDLVEPLAQVLARLGSASALVVHGHGRLDEISLDGPTRAALVKDGVVTAFTIEPRELGLIPAPIAAIAGGDAQQNAEITRRVLEGEAGPHREAVVINAAAALWVAGRAGDMAEGVGLAQASLDSGAARAKLAALVGLSQALARQEKEAAACG